MEELCRRLRRYASLARQVGAQRFGMGLLEAANSGAFVAENFENGEQLRELEQVVNLFCQMKQLELAAPAFGSGISAHELADAGAVDVIHVAQIQDNLGVFIVKQAADGFAEKSAPVAQRNLSAKVHKRA